MVADEGQEAYLMKLCYGTEHGSPGETGFPKSCSVLTVHWPFHGGPFMFNTCHSSLTLRALLHALEMFCSSLTVIVTVKQEAPNAVM